MVNSLIKYENQFFVRKNENWCEHFRKNDNVWKKIILIKLLRNFFGGNFSENFCENGNFRENEKSVFVSTLEVRDWIAHGFSYTLICGHSESCTLFFLIDSTLISYTVLMLLLRWRQLIFIQYTEFTVSAI
jgi:hypothetical protein